jgi:hypothetical protein
MDISWADGGRPRKKNDSGFDSWIKSYFWVLNPFNPQNQIYRILSSPSPSSCFLRQNFAGASTRLRPSDINLVSVARTHLRSGLFFVHTSAHLVSSTVQIFLFVYHLTKMTGSSLFEEVIKNGDPLRLKLVASIQANQITFFPILISWFGCSNIW